MHGDSLIQQTLEEMNQEAERAFKGKARDKILAIVNTQKLITELLEKLTTLKKELKALEVVTIDKSVIE